MTEQPADDAALDRRAAVHEAEARHQIAHDAIVIPGVERDVVAPGFGDESVRWALVIPLALNVVGGLCYWQASKSYAAELAAGK